MERKRELNSGFLLFDHQMNIKGTSFHSIEKQNHKIAFEMNNLQKEKKKSGLILMVDHPSENTDGSFSKPKPNYNPI